MSTRWHPLKHDTVNDNRCATVVNTLATDGLSLQGAHVVRPLTVSGPGPDTTALRDIGTGSESRTGNSQSQEIFFICRTIGHGSAITYSGEFDT